MSEPDRALDLGKTIRNAEGHRLIAADLHEARVRRERGFAWWMVSLSIAVILIGLVMALRLVSLIKLFL